MLHDDSITLVLLEGELALEEVAEEVNDLRLGSEGLGDDVLGARVDAKELDGLEGAVNRFR